MEKVETPLDQKNIVITRSLDQISEVKNLFQNKGATIFDLPAITIDYPDDLGPLDDALLEINNFHWIIFSSSNGIKFVDERLKCKGSSLKQCSKKTKIAVVGKRTSETLRELGIEADYIPPNFISESLIENFPMSGYGLRVFLPRVQTGGRNIISDEFRNAGARVVEVPAYESKCPNSIPKETVCAIKEKKINAIIFSSGKTVQNSAYLLEKQFGTDWLVLFSNVKLLTIGPQTSSMCEEVFGRVDKEAQQYTFKGLLDATIECLS